MKPSLGSEVNLDFWSGKKVLITGHTGFKGAWLSLVLSEAGAEVHGISLDPELESFYEIVGVADLIEADLRLDLRDLADTKKAVRDIKPDVIFHLAAQALVRKGYEQPAETYSTNISGTANLLASVRSLPATGNMGAILVITSDKVYESTALDGDSGFKEEDRLGGLDPYSSSKAMVEQMVQVFSALPSISGENEWQWPISTARAGNVIGGGDFAEGRLVPDCIKAFKSSTSVVLRYPDATRPWQHVLDPLFGYIAFAQIIYSDFPQAPKAMNFGPNDSKNLKVQEVAERLAEKMGRDKNLSVSIIPSEVKETLDLNLDASLALDVLGWRPRWSSVQAIDKTAEWHLAHQSGYDMTKFSLSQIDEFLNG